MRNCLMTMVGAVVAVLFLAGMLQAQETHVTMKNGASFSGLIVHETPRFLDLELGEGRIRLDKRKILKLMDAPDPRAEKKR